MESAWTPWPMGVTVKVIRWSGAMLVVGQKWTSISEMTKARAYSYFFLAFSGLGFGGDGRPFLAGSSPLAIPMIAFARLGSRGRLSVVDSLRHVV